MCRVLGELGDLHEECPVLEDALEEMREQCIIKNHLHLETTLDLSAAADYLIEKYHVKTPLPARQFETMLYYNDGYYVPGGYEICETTLGYDFGTRKNFEGKELLNRYRKGEIMMKVKERTNCEQYAQLSPVKVPTFDGNLDEINVCNGIYNWRTGEFREHTYRNLSRIQVAVKYNPNSSCPTIMEIIKDILKPEDVEKYIEFVGYCFYRAYPIQKAAIMYGPASSGKSTLDEIPANMIGIWNTTSVTLQMLGGRVPDQYATSKLYTKLINVAGDMDSSYVKEPGNFKMLTSGKEPVHARFIYGQPFEFVNFAKMIMAANVLPMVNDPTLAFYRRLEMFLALKKFSPTDTEKRERLRSISDPNELSGFFNECMSRLPALLERNDFTNASDPETLKREYTRLSTPIDMFAEDCIVETIHIDNYVSKEDLYAEYVNYCKLIKAPHDKYYGFCRKIRAVMDWDNKNLRERTVNNQTKRCWIGVSLISANDALGRDE